ncbi:dual specificity protein phosphatase family protein [Neotamlana laminarinivorans]|uniref:Dual specificity protein phosphatase family protein n=1 Tax=Neotamlana laminarinivorans TaxID=2883124 RepID=A0A9X1HY21_9FLAO|nr:dual specificity protein phosphatase family protein [Tamlana laminarinivorans]MCB4797676.1 dual specificity protein phosphatase family protein [Tamlana laminarinivorans]
MKTSYIFLMMICCSININAQIIEATKQESKNFKRFYKVSEAIYRSEQPSKKGFKEIEALGIKTILNFRRKWSDDKKTRHTKLQLEHIKLKSKEMTEAKVVSVLKIIEKAEKPILIHCWHGSDRTGIIIAAYRIVFENWTKADAIAEFRRPEFGYHEKWYPNLIDILNDLNVDEIRSELGIK